MAQIDTNMHAGNTDTRQDGGMLRDDQGKSWLRQLEAAGWKGILDTMRNFPGGADSTSSDDLPPHAKISHTAELNSADYSGNHTARATEKALHGESEAIRQMAFIPHQVEAPASGIRHLAYGIQPTVRGSEGEAVIAPSRRLTEPTLRDPVPERKVLVLATQENGVEVWVRDAKVTGAQMQMLLADVRRNIQSQGCEVLKVSLNGQQVYSDQSHRVKSNQSKGG